MRRKIVNFVNLAKFINFIRPLIVMAEEETGEQKRNGLGVVAR